MNKGWHHSEETKQKLKAANLGPNNPMYGKRFLGKSKTLATIKPNLVSGGTHDEV